MLAPSNPFVSLDPILAVDGVREAVAARRERVVAITPMIGGAAVKGPLAGMLETLGHEVGAVGVAQRARAAGRRASCSTAPTRRAPPTSRALGLRVTCVPTLMHDAESGAVVARAALALP